MKINEDQYFYILSALVNPASKDSYIWFLSSLALEANHFDSEHYEGAVKVASKSIEQFYPSFASMSVSGQIIDEMLMPIIEKMPSTEKFLSCCFS